MAPQGGGGSEPNTLALSVKIIEPGSIFHDIIGLNVCQHRLAALHAYLFPRLHHYHIDPLRINKLYFIVICFTNRDLPIVASLTSPHCTLCSVINVKTHILLEKL